MLEELTIAQAIGTVSTPVKRQTDIGGIQGVVLWERNSDGPVDYIATNHHTLSVYQGGGSGTWSCEHRAWGFSEAVCLLPQGYDTRWKHNGYVKNVHFYFTPEDIAEMNWTVPVEPTPVIYGRNRLMSTLSATMADDLNWSDPADRLAIDHIVLAIMSQISQAEKSRARTLSASVLNRLETRMHALCDGTPSLAELAAEVSMSQRHLTRLFKETTHMTLAQFQRKIQIDRAKSLLSQPLSLTEVAAACGFASQSHFTTVFRANTGATPAAWRRTKE